jgi:hypothetical protein
MSGNITCPECSQIIGMNNNHTIYGHAKTCFHLPEKGIKKDLDLIVQDRDRSDENVKRVTYLLNKALEAGEY